MGHIHTSAGDHDPTASAYIVRLDTPKPSLMLHRHKKLGVWLQFGGHVEIRENPWQAIAHELLEESGYDLSQMNVLQPVHRIKSMAGVVLRPIPIAPLSHKFPGLDHFHNDEGYGFTTNQTPRHKPDVTESDTFQCFSVDGLLAIPSSEIPRNVIEIGVFLLTEALVHWEQVPAIEWSLKTPAPHFD